MEIERLLSFNQERRFKGGTAKRTLATKARKEQTNNTSIFIFSDFLKRNKKAEKSCRDEHTYTNTDIQTNN